MTIVESISLLLLVGSPPFEIGDGEHVSSEDQRKPSPTARLVENPQSGLAGALAELGLQPGGH